MRRSPTAKHKRDVISWADVTSWYNEHSEFLRRYLIKILHSAHDANDIVQESFLHLWFARSSGPIHNPKAFLVTTALNLMKDNCRLAHTRATRDGVPVADVEIPDLSDPSYLLEADEALAQIAGTLKGLRPSTRRVFYLERVELRSHAQIASRMGITVSMVEKHAGYAMTALESSGFEQPRHACGRRKVAA